MIARISVASRVRLTLAAVCLACADVPGGDGLSAAGPAGSREPRAASAGQLLISEFRLRGPNGLSDEYIEIYNASGAAHTVAALSGSGYGIAASDGTTRCTIPNGTVIPNHGHFLCVNSVGYSLGTYPAGNGTTATGDATYVLGIADNAGIAIFNNNSGGASYSLANRLDAVGSTDEANTLYREGSGYSPLSPFSVDYSWTRRVPGQCLGVGCGGLGIHAPPVYATSLLDTNNNNFDFLFSDPSGTNAGAGSRIGRPGPENLSSPIMIDGSPALAVSRLSGCSARDAAPNRIRDSTSDPDNNSFFGTLDLRTSWKNTSGASLTRLRFRVVDVFTFPVIDDYADLRVRTSTSVTVTTDTYPCGTGTANTPVEGTMVETPPASTFGGGVNTSLGVASVSLATPLASGASVNVRFLLGIQGVGFVRFCVIPETLPAVAGEPWCYVGTTQSATVTSDGDYDFDQIAEMPMYNGATGQWKILKSTSGYAAQQLISWGGPGYTAVPGDYDGDGRFDAAVYQDSTGVWSILTSGSNFTRAFTVAYGGAGYIPVPGDYDGDDVTDVAIAGPATGLWAFLASSLGFTSGAVRTWALTGHTPIGGQDFDGDGRSDMVLYQERTGTWSVLQSSTDFVAFTTVSWGGRGYTMAPGDYDGDGKADYGLYHRATGQWSILKSIGGYTSVISKGWGGPGYLPVPADVDGDRRPDIAVYQPSTAHWTALESSTSYATVRHAFYGTAADAPLSTAVVPASSREIQAGDADGDFTSDLTIYHTASGMWSTLTSGSGFTSAVHKGWGGSGYTPVPGDYDGDGRGDLAVYQASTGQWLVLRSGSNFTTSYSFSAGGPGYVPVAGDYDGDGRADMVVYNTTTGLWYGLKSSGSFATVLSVSWGGTGYTAVPGDFDADGRLDPSLYQASSGNWLILKSSTNYTTMIARNFGGAGYAPAQGDFDGDGITDFAVYQAATGIWTMLKSSAANTTGFTVAYGGAGYTPVAGDWDGDGRSDVGVHDAAGTWSILLSNGNFTTSLSKSWGGAGHTPLPQFQ